MRAVTTADYLNVRYDQSVALLFAVMGMAQLSVNIGVTLRASSALIIGVTGGALSQAQTIFGLTALFVFYGVVGGLKAAILTDFVQGILTIVLSFLILPFALQAVGGIEGLKATVNDPTVFSLVAPGEITFLYVAVLSVNALIGWVTAPYTMAMCGAGKSEMASRVGFVSGMLIKRICTIAWVLTGMCAIGLFAGKAIDPDLVWGQLARDFLPKIAPGLIGLFVASMLAAVMSSCDCFMVSAAALFTENIYKPMIRPDKSEKHYIGTGRIASVIVVVFGIIIAFAISGVVEGLEIFWKIMAMMGIPIWASFFWRRATVAGTWASTLSSFAVWMFTSRLDSLGWDFNARFASYLPDFMLYNGELSLPCQMIFYLTTGLIVMIVVSILTRAPSRENLDRVYECLRTPVLTGEPEVEPLTLPEGIEPSPRKALFRNPNIELMKPGIIDIIGFVAACLAVGLLIGSFYWMLG
jgi:Na+/proline symporter